MVHVIGICDDSSEQTRLLERFSYEFRTGSRLDVFSETDPERFLALAAVKEPQVVFLDVDMGAFDGIRVGEALRRRYRETVIIYVTGHEEFALEAFRVRAFNYLLKPLKQVQFEKALDEALEHVQRMRGRTAAKMLSVQTKGEHIRIPYNDIIHFEKVGHKIRVHGPEQEIQYYGNFYSLLESLDSDRFFQCHQGFIVNVDRIRAFRDKTLFLEGGGQVPVSRSYVESVKNMLARSLFSEEGRS